MNSTLLRLFHTLPGPLRSCAASAHGYRLRSWRYGPETDDLALQATAREQWDSQQWRTWQLERLKRVLSRAATSVPFYRECWAERRRSGDHSSWELLENWPILDKEAVRANPRGFVADDCDVDRMRREHTSGTTGTPLTVWWSKETTRTWYAWSEARWRRWNGVSRSDRWAILGGQMVAPVARRRPPFWVWNSGLRQLYLSSYHLAPDLIRYYLDALKSHRIVYLLGYTSALYALAHEALRLGRRDLKMRVAITNAEPVFDYQRQAIAAAFQCPVRETYGMSEIVAAAGECEVGRLHLWPEVGIVEILDGCTPTSPGQAGDLVCTGLLNADMPLIRYRVGDRAVPATPDQRCSCGRLLPLLERIEGRIDDVLYTRDGRSIGRLDPVFKVGLPIREAQIVQESLECVRVRYVRAPGFTQAAENELLALLRSRLGSIEIVMEAVPQVPRTSNGKFRAVVCDLPHAQKRRLEGMNA